MPVRRKGAKYAIGSGRPVYRDRATAMRAYRGYMAHKMRGKGKKA